MNITAGLSDGSAIWPRFGYRPIDEREWASLCRRLRAKLPAIPCTAQGNANALKALATTDPRGIWTLAQVSDPVNGSTIPLGLALLRGERWRGTLDLQDPLAMDQLQSMLAKHGRSDSLMSFWKREGARLGRSPAATPELVSEESALAEELAQRDREEPGWDRGGRVAAARSALRIGMTTEDVSAIYGSEIAAEATSAESVQLRSVLLVEDSPAVGDTVADAMRARGLTVRVCESAEQALTYLQGVDLVLTDLEIPQQEQNGLDLIAKMRGLRPGLRIVSMGGSWRVRERARAAGASHCLVVDDFTTANLAATIERIRR